MSTAELPPTGVGPMSTAELPLAAGAATPVRRHPLGLFASELRVVFRRPRTIVLLGVLALVPLAIGLALRFAGPGGGGGDGPAAGLFEQVSNNGLFLVFIGLFLTLPFFLPMTVGVVAGDAISGEANLGTLRYLLVAPAGRTRLLLTKLVAMAVFCLTATLVVAGAGLVAGAALFPLGDVTLLSGDTISLPAALVRALVIALCVAASLLGLVGIGLFVSTLTDTPLAAMATTVGVGITAQILDQVPQLATIQPWLFPHYWLTFADLLRQPMFFDGVVHNLLLQAAYLAVFGAAAWARLTSRDVS